MGLLDGDLREVFGSVFAPLLLDAVITRVTLVPDGAGGLTETTATADAKGMVEQYSAYERARLGIPATDVKLILLQKDVPVRIDVHSKVMIRAQLYSVEAWDEDPAQASWTVQGRPILSAAGTGGAVHQGRLRRYRLAASAVIPTIADHSGQLRRAVLLALGASGSSTAAHEGTLRRGALSATGAPDIIVDHSGALSRGRVAADVGIFVSASHAGVLARMALAAAGTAEEEGATHLGRLARMGLTASGAPAIGGQAEGLLARAAMTGVASSRVDGEALAQMARGGVSASGSVPLIGEALGDLQRGLIAASGAPEVIGAAAGALRRGVLMASASPAVIAGGEFGLGRHLVSAEGAPSVTGQSVATLDRMALTATGETGEVPGGTARSLPVFRSASSVAYTTSLARPTGTVAGDLLLAVFGDYDGDTLTPPAGWTALGPTRTTTGVRARIAYKIAGASEPTTYSFSTNGVGAPVGIILRYDTVDPSIPIAASDFASGTSTTRTMPSLTNENENSMLVTFSMGEFGGETSAAPAGMTERADVEGLNIVLAYDQAIASAGATGTKTHAQMGNEQFIGFSILINGAPS